MKAFILAAGHGTRLRPLTDSIPKCLVPIRGVPLLEIWLDLCRTSGIDEVLVNVHSHAEQVSRFLTSHDRPPFVTVVQEPTLLGSAGTLIANQAWVQGESFFWVFYGDVLTNMDLTPMLRLHLARKPVATLGIYHVQDPSRCGVVELDEDGTVNRFVEKPTNPPSKLAFAGVMLGSQAMLEVVSDDRPADIGFDVLPQLARRAVAYPIDDYLMDIGTIENYEQAQKTWPGLKGMSPPHVQRNRI